VSVGNYHHLKVWQASMQLAEQVYKLTANFPSEERFGLSSQLRRAAASIPSNIAEGNARTSNRDYLRFITMSLGSLAEVETQLELSVRLEYLNTEDKERFESHISELARMLRGMQKRLVKLSN